MTECDALIVGGGVAGATTALAIVLAGRRAIVIEANIAKGRRVGETLDPAARPLLESLGVWGAFVHAGHVSCPGTVSIWGSPQPTHKDFVFNPYGQAWQLDRANFDESLLIEAEQRGALVRRGQSYDSIKRLSTGWEVGLPNETVRATWLIDATGRRATLARRLGRKREPLDRLVAVHSAATAASDGDRDGRVFLESLPQGWCYSALIPGGRRVFSIQTDADLLPTQEWRDQSWITKCLRETTLLSSLIDRHAYTFPDQPQLTSAHSGCLESFAGDGWLAVGDAAMSFDPLSGQGILKAMKSGLQAAETIHLGTEASRERFIQANDTAWRNFAVARRNYYASERRWRDNTFWLRRQGE